MKKIVNFLCLAAFATAIFAGCSKNESPENLPETSNKKTISFSAKTAETKTYFGDKTTSGYPTVWSENQQVKITVDMASQASSTNANVTPSANGKTASFDASVVDDEGGSYTFYAISPASACISTSMVASVRSFNVQFPATQTPTMGSVDEAAHIMAASTETFTTLPENVTLNFAHIAAYGRFMLKNFPETVTIQSIDLAADENIVGRVYFTPSTGGYEDQTAAKILTINTSAISAESNASKVFWFGIKPVDLQGKKIKFTVHTSGGDYIKTITFPSGKGNFLAGKVASFNIDMDGITPGTDKVYTLVTSYDQLNANSEVIIVAQDFNYAISTTQQTNNRVAASVTKGTNTITNPSDAVQTFTLMAGSVSNTVAFKCINGDKADYFINGITSGNYLHSDNTTVDASASFNVTISSGTMVLKANNSSDRNYMRYNPNSGNPIFSLYAETSPVNNAVAIYKLEGTGTGAGLVDGGSSSYDFTTVSQLNAKTTSASATFNGKLTDAVVSYVPDANNAVIKDATGSILVYKTGHGLTQGQTLTGEITATTKLFNGTSEITAYTATFTGSGATVAPVTYTLTQLIGNLSTYQNAYAKVESLTINAISGKNLLVKNGSNTYYVYANAGVPSGIVEGDIITVIGTVAHYGDNDQIKVWSDDNFTKTGHVTIPTHTISWSAPSHGSFTVQVDGSTITSGTAVAEGKTVTLTASPATGYAFSSWTVTGATVSGNTNVATFVVGTSNVTISASFVASSETTVTSTDLGPASTTATSMDSYISYVHSASNSYTNPMRLYSGTTFTISASGGKRITKIVFTCNNESYATTLAGSTFTVASGASASASASGKTVTVTITGNTSSVAIKMAGQVRLDALSVTYR
ncbi:MAG: hypothetical protein IKS82_00780 [Bacteroidales bacterium]|nr:hypothetical protein [Bacteroidales bacterium]